MSNVTINQLPTASTIDATQDLLPIYTNNIVTTQAISRNTLLGITSQPVGISDIQTLTNKTLTSPAISSPVLSGTLTGTYTIGGTPTFPSSIVTLTGSQVLTNKTLTSPVINGSITSPQIAVGINDVNGATWIGQTSVGSAVNYLNIANSSTTNAPVLSSLGSDSNIDLQLTPKGTGQLVVNGRYDGWVTGVGTPNTVAYNGNRNYSVVFNSVDLTSKLSNGMRLKLTRTVTAPTQCTSLNGTTQYYSKTSPAGMTFTNNFVVSAWVKATAYQAGQMIASRYNGTSGWYFGMDSTGRVILTGFNAGAANFKQISSYQSVPLNKWVHVTAQLDMTSATNSPTVNYVMIDGVDVPAVQTSGGTAPTALIQAGNLEIGSTNGGTLPFPGKIAQVAIFSAKVTQATIQGYISQGLAGTETSLISAYSFNNSINDLNTTNANNLTANGSAVATNADSPFGLQADGTTAGTTEYAIITKTAFSTNTTLTLQVPEGNAIPTSGGVSAVSYSTQKSPYGFVISKDRWVIESLYNVRSTKASPVSGTAYNIGGEQITIPTGSWNVGYKVFSYGSSTTAVNTSCYTDLQPTSATFVSSSAFAVGAGYINSNTEIGGNATVLNPLSLTAQTIYYLNTKMSSGGTTANLLLLHDFSSGRIYAEPAAL